MVTLIVKPSEACNAACVYCEVNRKGWLKSKIMSQETLEMLFARIDAFLKERRDEQIKIVWHGGEPLLIGEPFYRRVLAAQRQRCADTESRIRHTVQTNMTLFSEAFVDVFRALGITSIGTSYDPVTEVRVLKGQDSRAYDEAFLAGTARLEQAGFDWGVICVVTRLSLERPLDLFYFLTNLAPQGGVMFNPILLDKQKQQHLAIDDKEFSAFLGVLFPVWWAHRQRYPRVEPFHSLTETILSGGRRQFYCTDAGQCADTHIGIGPDGAMTHCGRSGDWGLLDYGSIHQRSFSEVFADARRVELRRRGEALRAGACRDCDYWALCHGGCPLDSWDATGSFLGKTAWCDSRGGFVKTYFEPITGLKPKLMEGA